MNATKQRPAPAQYTPEWYASPIDLPERAIGNFRIAHEIIPVGGHVGIVGMRQAILRGLTPVAGKVQDKPLRIHRLEEGAGNLWMTDLPEELNQIGELMFNVQPHGSVCVGGLGLGILAAVVAQWPGVDEVVVVERSPEVIELCAQPQYTTVRDDIGNFLKQSSAHFDFFLLDTWAGTGEAAWWNDVVPLRRTIRQRWGRHPVIHCWAEDIMLGQIMRNITQQPPHWFTKYLPVPMTGRDAQRFVRDIGLPAWEKSYGAAIDRTFAELGDD